MSTGVNLCARGIGLWLLAVLVAFVGCGGAQVRGDSQEENAPMPEWVRSGTCSSPPLDDVNAYLCGVQEQDVLEMSRSLAWRGAETKARGVLVQVLNGQVSDWVKAREVPKEIDLVAHTEIEAVVHVAGARVRDRWHDVAANRVHILVAISKHDALLAIKGACKGTVGCKKALGSE